MLEGQERFRQLSFLHLYRSGRPPKPKYPEVDQTCSDVFEVIDHKWQELGFEVPDVDNIPELGTRSPINDNLSIRGTGGGMAQFRPPKVSQIEVPDEFQDLVSYYCSSTQEAKTRLPTPEKLMAFFETMPPSVRWEYSFDYYRYYDWMIEYFGVEALSSTRPTSITLWIHDAATPQLDTSYTFSLKRVLVKFSQSFKPEAKYAKKAYQYEDMSLHTSASFRGKKLYRLWQEVPNGTFFPDPRGDMDDIYPYWLKDGIDVQADRNGTPATELDLEKYLEKIRRGDQVVDPRTKYWAHLTERQVLNRLQIAREYIYNKVPQVFYFRRLPDGLGFIGCEGYRMRSKVKRGQFYVAKNGSYREFDWADTEAIINQWVAGLD